MKSILPSAVLIYLLGWVPEEYRPGCGIIVFTFFACLIISEIRVSNNKANKYKEEARSLRIDNDTKGQKLHYKVSYLRFRKPNQYK